MRSLLDALQAGRLIELTDNHKTKALEYLAALIEAIPAIGVKGGITENVLAHEAIHNTGIGKGWACPHGRALHGNELVCSIGWSPTGIDYGAPDNEPVHILVMYYVPDTQKHSYLKEISLLAKAIQTQPPLQDLKSLKDLGEVRDRLLDAIHVALESTTPDARARMIRLEVKHAAARELGLPPELARSIIPLSILSIPGSKPVILCQDREMVQILEAQADLTGQLAQSGRSEHNGIQVLLRSSSNFQPDRVLYDCLAFRPPKNNSRPPITKATPEKDH